MDGGVDSLSLLAPVGDPQYRRLRPTLAVDGGRAFAEDARLDVASRGVGAGRPARRGQGLGAARGRLHERRPVALHLAPLLGGRRARPAPAHGLARPRARPRRLARQPAAGRVAGRAALADAGDRAQPGRGDQQARGLRLLDAGRVGRGRGPRRARRSRTSGTRCAAPATPPSRRPRRRRRSRAACATRSRRWAPTASRPTRPRPPTRSRPRPSRSGSRASPRCSPPGCRSAPPRSARRAPTTRTPTRRSRCPRT